MMNNGGDTRTAHGHQHFLQLESVVALTSLSSKDQDLLLDGDRVHAAVHLPLGIYTP